MTEYIAVDKEQLSELRRYAMNNLSFVTNDIQVSSRICNELQKLIDSPPMKIDAWVTPENKLLFDGDWHVGLYESCRPLYSIPDKGA